MGTKGKGKKRVFDMQCLRALGVDDMNKITIKDKDVQAEGV